MTGTPLDGINEKGNSGWLGTGEERNECASARSPESGGFTDRELGVFWLRLLVASAVAAGSLKIKQIRVQISIILDSLMLKFVELL